ncbi:MAG: hypothetical protein ABL917_01960 [Parcubacteria group bacterium]
MFDIYISFFSNEQVIKVLNILYYSSPIWITGILLYVLWDMWVLYVRESFQQKQTHLLLEIKLPKEIFKSPKAAEFFIASLYQTAGEKNWFEKYWEGKVRAHFSLEIVAVDGNVHFYVWTRKGFKATIESNLYSQYPGIEVHEVADYTLPVSYDTDKYTFWGTEFDLTKDDVFPIKTYVDYGMDKDPKEEYKIDPLTPLIEFLGNLGRDQQVWIQIIIRSHKAEEKDPSKNWANAKIWTTFRPKDIWDRWEKKDLRWKEAAKEQIEKIIAGTKGEKDKEGKLIPGTGRQLTDVEKETVSALSRSISKNGFDVGMRAVYFAPKDSYSPTNIGGIIGGITHFNSHLNGFKPARGSDERYSNVFLAWKKRSAKKRYGEIEEKLDSYKRRAYFYKPFKSPHFILNVEELATIFHFPGQVSTTPTFTRIESRKGEAPANIPL